MIKFLTVYLTLCSVSVAFANPTADFDTQKKRTLGFIQERLDTITAHKACVEKATNQDQLRECNKNQRMSAMKQRQDLMKEKK